MINMVQKQEKRQRRIFVDARSIVLMRETSCERASALVASNANLDILASELLADSQSNLTAPGPGPGAMRFGTNFENWLLADNAQELIEPLNKLYKTTFRSGHSDKGGDVTPQARSGEGEEHDALDGRKNIWSKTSERIKDRWTNHEHGSILVHGILRIPGVERPWYLEPDLLVSPPGCSYYTPFEIKSYERNAFIVNEQEITAAVVQSSIYLHCLIYGSDPDGVPYPEITKPRTNYKTGIIFRKNGSARYPDLMLADAQRDLHAIATILENIPSDDQDFKKRFGIDRDEIRSGSLKALEHIKATYSDACTSGCLLASRCRGEMRKLSTFSAWGDGLRDAYSGYETIPELLHNIQSIQHLDVEDIEDPDLRRIQDIETQIDTLIARAI